jgi:hypothetical protein
VGRCWSQAPEPDRSTETRRIRSDLGNCDTAVIRPPSSNSRNTGIVFGFWSGARDLNPGPHGPEPCWLHILQCPGGSPDDRLNSNCRNLVSIRVLLEPPGSGNLCPGCAPARGSRLGPANISH